MQPLAESFEVRCFVPSRLDGRALEAVVTLAAGGAVDPARAAVFVHPYAPLGGQLRNNVIDELRARLAAHAAVAVAVNLRGAGRSEGRTSWTGAAELEDLRSVLAMLAARRLPLHPRRHDAAERRSLRAQLRARGFIADDAAAADADADADALPLPPVARVLLCGYSYGAAVAAAVAPAEYPRLRLDYAHISLPYSVLWALFLHRRAWVLQRLEATVCASAAAATAAQTLFVAGSADAFTSLPAYDRWWAQLRAAAEHAALARTPDDPDAARAAAARALAVVRIPNADHAWLRREREVADAVADWWGVGTTTTTTTHPTAG
ncbi:hypothetical protein H4R18_004130 [Coemansia javaensis]|uniref:AB hydrolase-1 domain-containing protein n=1 Tax=Coemansia javaensis TaxID=2761396 RepID=A0A9W8LFA3_9FUNG|nr:hypothetical protein H4R18_004130 [Coemansia javaensis]